MAESPMRITVGDVGVGSGQPVAASSVDAIYLDPNYGTPQTRYHDGKVWLKDQGARNGTVRLEQPGRCGRFEGNEKVATPVSLAAAHSIFVRFQIAVTPSTFGALVVFESGGTFTFLLIDDSNNFSFWSSGDGHSDVSFGVTAISTSVWHSLLITRSGNSGTLTCYFDGVSSGTLAAGASTATTSLTADIGHRAAQGFNGFISQAMFYDRELTAGEAASLHASTQVAGSLVARYYLDEAAGSVALDSSGSGNHGTITAASLVNFHNSTANDVYSAQNEIGYSKWVDQFGSAATSRVIFPPAAINANVTIEYECLIDDAEFVLLGDSTSASHAAYLGEDGSASTALTSLAGTPSLFIDDVLQTPSTRDDLHSLISGSRVRVKMASLDLSSWTAATTSYTNGIHSFNTVGRFRNFKVDIGSTGSWDFESATGDDNGFSRTAQIGYVPLVNATTDALGGAAQYSGPCPHDGRLLGPCATFNGVDDLCAAENSANVISSNMSFGGWFELPVGSSTDGYVTKSVNDQWGLFHEGTFLKLRVLASNDVTVTHGLSGLHHVFATISGTTGKVYIDGLEVASGTLNAMPSTNGSSIQVGKFGTVYPYSGRAFGVHVYGTRTLTADEVLYLATNGLSGTDPGDTGLFDFWHMQETTGIVHAGKNGNNLNVTTSSQANYHANQQDVFDALTAANGKRNAGQTVDVFGDEPNSPYAQQLAALGVTRLQDLGMGPEPTGASPVLLAALTDTADGPILIDKDADQVQALVDYLRIWWDGGTWDDSDTWSE